jgi:hypothetical protein
VSGETQATVGHRAGRLVFDDFDSLLSDDRIVATSESTLGLNGLQYSGSDSIPESWCASRFYLQIATKLRAEERT